MKCKRKNGADTCQRALLSHWVQKPLHMTAAGPICVDIYSWSTNNNNKY